MVRYLAVLIVGIVVLSGVDRGYPQSAVRLHAQAVKWLKRCRSSRHIAPCRKALRLYQRALEVIGPQDPGAAEKIRKRIEEIQRILRSLRKVKVGKTPKYKSTIEAVKRQDALGLERFLRGGGDPNVVDEQGRSALHYAAQMGDAGLKLLKILLKYKADPNVTDSQGVTPLHLAAFAGSKEAVERLLAAGADPTLKDTRGHTPYDLAPREVRSLLEARLKMRVPPGSVVELDGNVVGVAGDSGIVEVAAAPGLHRLVVKKKGFEEYEREVELKRGEQRLRVFLVKRRVAEGVVRSVKISTPPKRTRSSIRYWGMALVAGGIVTAGIGGLMTYLAWRAREQVESAATPQDMEDARRRMHVYNAAALGCYIGGGVLTGSGMVLWIVGSKAKPKIGLGATPGSLMLWVNQW